MFPECWAVCELGQGDPPERSPAIVEMSRAWVCQISLISEMLAYLGKTDIATWGP